MKAVLSLRELGLSLACLFTLAGCAENESMLFIRGVMKVDADSCEVTADESAVLLANGVWDVAFGSAYSAALLVGNQLASQGDKSRNRTETSSIRLEGAEITLRHPNDDLIREEKVSPGAGFVQVGTGESTGYDWVGLVVIPSSVGPDLIPEGASPGYLIADMKVFGTTLGGEEVESGSFKFPINYCRGCLVSFPPGSMEDGVCTGSEDSAASPPCNLGQDDVVACDVCSRTHSVCREP